MEVDEEECIGGFLERLEKGTGPTEYARKTCYFDGRAPQQSVRKRKRTKLAARPGEQVSAYCISASWLEHFCCHLQMSKYILKLLLVDSIQLGVADSHCRSFLLKFMYDRWLPR